MKETLKPNRQSESIFNLKKRGENDTANCEINKGTVKT